MHGRGFFSGKDALNVAGILLLKGQQLPVNLLPVHLRLEIDLRAESALGGKNVITGHPAVFLLQPAHIPEYGIDMEHFRAGQLTVVAQQHDVGVLRTAGLVQRLQHPAQLLIHKIKRPVQFGAVDAQLMPLVVHIGEVQQHEIRLVLPDDVYGALGGKFVHLRRFHPAEHMLVGFKDLRGGRAVGLLEPRRRIVLLLRRPDLSNVIVRAAGAHHRPGHRSGGKAVGLGVVDQRGNADIPAEPVPVRTALRAGLEPLVVADAVAVRIAARGDGRVTGVCQRRINAEDILGTGSALHDPSQMG